MRNFKLLILIFFTTFLNAEYNLNRDYLLACTIHSYDKVHQNKIKSSVAKASLMLEDFFKNELKVKIVFFDSEDEMFKEYKKFKEFNTSVFYLSYYLNNREEIDKYSKDYYAFSSKDKFFSYVLIANNDSKIDSIEDLKNKRYVNFSADENLASWLDYKTLKTLKKPYKKIISEQIDVTKASRALLNLFFDKADFTLVKKEVYEDMLVLNPAMKKKLKVVAESKKMFLYGVGVFNKNVEYGPIETFFKYTNEEGGRSLLGPLYKLLDQTSIQPISKEELTPMINYFEEYQELKKRYDAN